MKLNLQNKRVHFIGIGGVSMKVLAKILKKFGAIVSGSDLNLGGHDPKNVDGCDLVVYTAAINDDNVELAKARELGIPVITRGELLGRVCELYKYSIAVAGTHGKTTTTGMLWECLKPLKPTVHIGGSYSGMDSLISSNNNIFITEACEYQKSFLHLAPNMALILNVDLDHTDCYKDIGEINSSFAQFAANSKDIVIVNGDEFPHVEGIKNRIITVGLLKHCDFQAACLSVDKRGRYSFCVRHGGAKLGRVSLSVAGKHNVYNALFAVATAYNLGVSFGRISVGLAGFKGTSRRMEFLGYKEGSIVFSDYAHHPKEITMTLLSAKESNYKHIVAIFEPHTYTRTHSFYAEFALALTVADEVILLPVYAAREAEIEGVSSKLILDEIVASGHSNVHLMETYEQAKKYLQERMKDDSAIIFMGAGTVDILAREFYNQK